MIMLNKEIVVKKHDGCQNRHHCKKDESKCCYLLSSEKCYLDSEDSEVFL